MDTHVGCVRFGGRLRCSIARSRAAGAPAEGARRWRRTASFDCRLSRNGGSVAAERPAFLRSCEMRRLCELLLAVALLGAGVAGPAHALGQNPFVATERAAAVPGAVVLVEAGRAATLYID